MNIKLHYLYRDYGNNKVYGSIIFSNPKQLAASYIKAQLEKKLMDETWFKPELMNIPRLTFENYPYNPELDHPYNELYRIEPTAEQPTDPAPSITSSFLLSIFISADMFTFMAFKSPGAG